MDNKKIDVLQRLARARALREKSAGYVLSDEELAKAKQEGRLTGEQIISDAPRLRGASEI